MSKRILSFVIMMVMCLWAAAPALGAGEGQETGGGQHQAPEGDRRTPPDGELPEIPDGMELPEGMEFPEGGPPEGMGFGGSGAVVQGTAAATIDEDAAINDAVYTSEGDNENALRIAGDVQVSLDGITVEKSGGATGDTEDSDFYGQNAALLASDGVDVTITDALITSNAQGGNAVFSYGTDTFVEITGSTIRTEQSNSGGIHVTGGGTLIGNDLDIETQGNSSAAIRSDRGGGTMTVSGGSYVTNGTGSPAIYSTADISVTGASLTANNSEALVIEGKNSITLVDCQVAGNMRGTYADSGAENIHTVMIYQSMSGDADVGPGEFYMTGGSLTGLNGDMFYVTNTDCTVYLSGVELTLGNENLLVVSGNDGSRGLGNAGENGGRCTFTADDQMIEGIISVDEISELDLAMISGTLFTGAINPSGDSGLVNVTMDEGSVWTLSADSYVSSFSGTTDNLALNGYTLYVGGEAFA